MSFEEDFLAHYGKKGMRWGKRNSNPGVSVSSKKGLSYKEYKKDPTFKREVKATYKGKGIEQGITWKDYTITNSKGEPIKNSNLKIGVLNNQFKNSKKERVSKDFAEAVIKGSNRRAIRQTLGVIGGATAIAAGLSFVSSM